MRSNVRAEIEDAIRQATPQSQPLAAAVAVNVPESTAKMPVVVETLERRPILATWAQRNRAQIQDWLRTSGAVLFRGFDVNSMESFGEAADAMVGGRIAYTNRSSPRTTVGDRIYTSTDYPQHLPIFPHNEHGYSPVFPLYVFFCCLQTSITGGATPVGSTRHIRAAIPPWIRERFREKKILYVRNYHEGFGLPWQKAFQTTDKAEVERYCRSRGVTCEWRDKNVLRTRRIGPAEIAHPFSGEPIWFNHATFYHVSTLPDAIREEMLAAFDEDELPNHTYYGDGSQIESNVLDSLRAAYIKHMNHFEWHKGDVLALDNMLSVHAREPYTGSRRVLVSMAEEICVN
jgi:alpha-ketoglutarate-dependent taurine dioxygenase